MIRFSIKAYHDDKLRRLAECLSTVDETRAIEWIWKHIQKGFVVVAENTETGGCKRYDVIEDPYKDDIVLPH